MKNKGFTMVEILAVFTLTAIILLITVPLITGMLKKGDDTAYEEFKNTIFIAVEAFTNDETTEFTVPANSCGTNQIATLTIGDLVSSGYLKSTVINPNNDKKVLDEVNKKLVIKVCRDDENVLNFEIEGVK